MAYDQTDLNQLTHVHYLSINQWYECMYLHLGDFGMNSCKITSTTARLHTIKYLI